MTHFIWFKYILWRQYYEDFPPQSTQNVAKFYPFYVWLVTAFVVINHVQPFQSSYWPWIFFNISNLSLCISGVECVWRRCVLGPGLVHRGETASWRTVAWDYCPPCCVCAIPSSSTAHVSNTHTKKKNVSTRLCRAIGIETTYNGPN